jgi:hypothetical protein
MALVDVLWTRAGGGGSAGAHAGAKLLTVVHGMLAGRDCIDDLDVLRCAAIGTVLGGPSGHGTLDRGDVPARSPPVTPAASTDSPRPRLPSRGLPVPAPATAR